MLRILLAEDDPLIVEGLSELLANEGYAVVSSPTQAGAVTDLWRNSSRWWTLEMWTSMQGTWTAFRASRIA